MLFTATHLKRGTFTVFSGPIFTFPIVFPLSQSLCGSSAIGEFFMTDNTISEQPLAVAVKVMQCEERDVRVAGGTSIKGSRAGHQENMALVDEIKTQRTKFKPLSYAFTYECGSILELLGKSEKVIAEQDQQKLELQHELTKAIESRTAAEAQLEQARIETTAGIAQHALNLEEMEKLRKDAIEAKADSEILRTRLIQKAEESGDFVAIRDRLQADNTALTRRLQSVESKAAAESVRALERQRELSQRCTLRERAIRQLHDAFDHLGKEHHELGLLSKRNEANCYLLAIKLAKTEVCESRQSARLYHAKLDLYGVVGRLQSAEARSARMQQECDSANREAERLRRVRSAMAVHSFSKLGFKPPPATAIVAVPPAPDPAPRVCTIRQPIGVQLAKSAWTPPAATLLENDDTRLEAQLLGIARTASLSPPQDNYEVDKPAEPLDTPASPVNADYPERTVAEAALATPTATTTPAARSSPSLKSPVSCDAPVEPLSAVDVSEDEGEYVPEDIMSSAPAHQPHPRRNVLPPKHPRSWDIPIERPTKQPRRSTDSYRPSY